MAMQLKSLSLDTRAKDMIVNLLKFMPGLRLGMLRNGINDIWNHPFLTGEDPTFPLLPLPPPLILTYPLWTCQIFLRH